jgi:hypothetical protein
MKRERYQTIFGILFVAILTFFMFVSSSNSQVFDDQWGGYGGGDGQFDKPIGIAIDYLGNVFVTDTGNSRVQKLDLRGNYITSWGAYGTGNGQFQSLRVRFPAACCDKIDPKPHAEYPAPWGGDDLFSDGDLH